VVKISPPDGYREHCDDFIVKVTVTIEPNNFAVTVTVGFAV